MSKKKEKASIAPSPPAPTSDPQIDPEFAALIPPLDPKERALLEANLLQDGCRDPLVVWKGERILLDGHHRFDICKRHGIKFQVVELGFRDRDKALRWALENQLGRRNLTDFARTELALKLKPFLEAENRAKQKAGGKQKVVQKSAQPPMRTRDAVAKAAGVSHDTVTKTEKLVAKADEETKAALRRGDVSINKAHNALATSDAPPTRRPDPPTDKTRIALIIKDVAELTGSSINWTHFTDLKELRRCLTEIAKAQDALFRWEGDLLARLVELGDPEALSGGVTLPDLMSRGA